MKHRIIEALNKGTASFENDNFMKDIENDRITTSIETQMIFSEDTDGEWIDLELRFVFFMGDFIAVEIESLIAESHFRSEDYTYDIGIEIAFDKFFFNLYTL